MAGKIPQSFVDEVRQKVNIIDVIGQYTELVKRGKQYNGSCPFHDDHHPSLFVDETKQVYNCFSCGRSGSVFSFVMEKEGLSFPETVLSLAESVGMTVSQQMASNVTHQTDGTTQQIYQLYVDAQKMYQHILLNTTSGEKALAYLHNKRQLSDDIIQTFGIGFVPEDNVLLQYAQDKGISSNVLSQSELFIENNSDGKLRDRFSGRIVWPIKNDRGQVVGFSGRSLRPNDQIKYMNSPESPFFNKSKLLYNFDLAKATIRQTSTVFIFEGFMDVIAAHMADTLSGVATMGTALTKEHIQLVSRYAKQVMLVYDGDEPGQRAAKRSIHLIRQYAPKIKMGIVLLPDNLDPDEMRTQRGVDNLKRALQQSVQTPVEFLIENARFGKNLSNQSQYLSFINDALTIIAEATPVEQDIQIKRLANEFNTSQSALQAQLAQIVTQTSVTQPKRSNATQNDVEQAKSPFETVDVNHSITRVEQAERALIMAMIKSPSVLAYVKQTEGFAFIHSDYQLLMMLVDIYHNQHPTQFDLAQFMDFIQKPELNQKLMAMERVFGDLTINDEAIHDYLHIIVEEAPLDEKINRIQEKLNIAKAQHDQTQMITLMTELIQLKRQKQQYSL